MKPDKEQPLILAVDRNKRNLDLLQDLLEKAGYSSRTASSVDALDEQLRHSEDISLVLLDLSGFDGRIWSRCDQLRENHVPFLVISPRQSAAIQRESITHGAQGMLVKPLVMRELLSLIRSMLDS